MNSPFRQYCRESRTFLKQYPGFGNFLSLVRLFPRWKKAQTPGYSTLDSGEPWIPFTCAEFLREKIRPGWKIFEYGAGGSTVFFASLGAEVISVEHDPAWAEKTRALLAALKPGGKWEIRLTAPETILADRRLDPADPQHFASRFPGFEKTTFMAYAKIIEDYPDGSFDMVLVDGRARPSCLALAARKIKAGGFLVLDDSERQHYQAAAVKLPQTWQKKTFAGPRPAGPFASAATVWKASSPADI